MNVGNIYDTSVTKPGELISMATLALALFVMEHTSKHLTWLKDFCQVQQLLENMSSHRPMWCKILLVLGKMITMLKADVVTAQR